MMQGTIREALYYVFTGISAITNLCVIILRVEYLFMYFHSKL